MTTHPILRWGWFALVAGMLAALLGMRANAILAGRTSPVDLLAMAALLALLVSPLFKEVTLGGVTLRRELAQAKKELAGAIQQLHATVTSSVAVAPTFNVQLQQLVRSEVGRAQEEALRIMASLDLELLALQPAGRGNDLRGREGLLRGRIAETEALYAAAPPAERAHYGTVLRSLYLMLLECSGDPQVRNVVTRGLERLASLPAQSPARVSLDPSTADRVR
ncbi:MAG TPA: hypothetical protein VGD77_06345 [Gemmatimonadaceae bacterium]